jgi:hypothetical protein
LRRQSIEDRVDCSGLAPNKKPIESRLGSSLEWRADKPAAWIAAHAKRLYRFDSHILTQGWWDALDSGEILGASAHAPRLAAWVAAAF